jgi:putative alpha-1,2-mannosidase
LAYSFNPFSLTSESEGGDFTEGNAWQWTWHVQHDVQGLISLFGTKENFVKKLNTLFETNIEDLPGHEAVPDVTGLIGLYAQGNEPSHHIAYLYTCAGRPDRAAEIFAKYSTVFIYRNVTDSVATMMRTNVRLVFVLCDGFLSNRSGIR